MWLGTCTEKDHGAHRFALAFAVTARPVVVWVTPDGFCRHPCLPIVSYAKSFSDSDQPSLGREDQHTIAPDLVIIRDRDATTAARVCAVDRVGRKRAVVHSGGRLEAWGNSTPLKNLHLPWSVFYELSRQEQRRHELSQFELIGTSVHAVSEAVFAAETGLVSYVLVGTMFPTPSHPEKEGDDQVEGVALMRAVCEALSGSSLQCYGIGGITAANMSMVLEAGAHGVATIRNIEAILGHVARQYGRT
ncbi:hypothetical protein F1559_004726 [Cyanidiococcus yangmingshanensis]|uniref:Thiamine phosphate synthase/TenI domain-containing protein n=1 Tax=Cyanidiococcus yangmingshanensis TaxID=2690220 RepID=A0A7J7ILP7_9RHOD|nr:hypothetical protein F1559_004726 [Cyanidiococcus yangmingshanensis]